MSTAVTRPELVASQPTPRETRKAWIAKLSEFSIVSYWVDDGDMTQEPAGIAFLAKNRVDPEDERVAVLRIYQDGIQLGIPVQGADTIQPAYPCEFWSYSADGTMTIEEYTGHFVDIPTPEQITSRTIVKDPKDMQVLAGFMKYLMSQDYEGFSPEAAQRLEEGRNLLQQYRSLPPRRGVKIRN